MQTSTAPKTKYVINVDWLECLFSGYPISNPSGNEYLYFDNNRIAMHHRKINLPHFLNFYDVVIDGKPFCTLKCNPRNPEIFGKDIVSIKIDNARLYEIGWKDTLDYFTHLFTYKLKNVSRLDIALDGHGFLAIGQKVYNREIRRVGRAQFLPYLNSNMDVLGYEIGKRVSDKSFICYDKSKELEKTNKYYIRNRWEKSGLDTSRPVERLELCLRNDAIKMIENFQFCELDNFEYLASLMRSHCPKMFEFRKPKKKTNIARWDNVEFIDWSSIGGVYLPRLSAQATTEVGRYKQACKTAYFTYVQTGKEVYINMARDFAFNVNCGQWMMDRMDKWKEEVERKLGKNADGVIQYQYLSQFREYNENTQVTIFEHAYN